MKPRITRLQAFLMCLVPIWYLAVSSFVPRASSVNTHRLSNESEDAWVKRVMSAQDAIDNERLVFDCIGVVPLPLLIAYVGYRQRKHSAPAHSS
jgi:hypothetical protein